VEAQQGKISLSPQLLVLVVLKLKTKNLQLRTVLFARRVRRSAHMQVAQIAQGCPVFVAHAPCEVRVTQPLVARRLRHILQHTQPLLNRLPAVRRHLLPFRQHFITDVVALLRRHPLPDLRSLAQLLLLLWRKLPESLFIPLESLALFRRKLTRTPRRIRWTVPVEVRPLDGLPVRMGGAIPPVAGVPGSPRRIYRGRIARRFGIPPLRLRPLRFSSLLPALLPLRLPSLLVLLLPLFLRRFVFLTALRPIRVRILRGTRQRHPRADQQCQRPSAGLEPPFHRALHILILLTRIVSRHRLWQFR
jgi:hypothetical protein